MTQKIKIEFKNESELRDYIKSNIPIAIKPERKSKYSLVNPFTSKHAISKVINSIVHSLINKPSNKKKRSLTQNAALHLFFTHISKALINLSIDYHSVDIFSGEIVYVPYNDYLVKKFIWGKLQKTMFGIESTTELDTKMINEILEVLKKFFADRGIEINFPSRFDLLIKELEKSNRL